jgi:carboxyl-terminal processing protease
VEQNRSFGASDLMRVGLVIVLVALLTGVAFAGGFFTGGLVYGAGGSNSPARVTIPAGATPATPAAGTPAGATPGTTFQLFWDVWGLLQTEYYGDLPDEQHMTYGAIRGVLGTLDDKFTSFIEPDVAEILRQDSSGSFEGIGALVRINADNQLEIVRPFPDQPAAKAGVLAGDIITHVDGKPMAGYGIYEAINFIRGPAGSVVTLTIVRRGAEKPFDVQITRAAIEIPLVESRMLDGGVGYVSLSQFSDGGTTQLRAAIQTLLDQNPKGLILDLRDDPGGLLREAISVSDTFLPDGVVVIERRRDGTEDVYRSKNGDMAEDIPLVVLVNGGSASASEIVAGALQDRGRAKLIGDVTFGKGSVQLPHELSDGSELRVTIARWFTPNDRAIHGKGLTPDIAVTITPDDAKAGKDPQLDRAVQYILEGK